jgi:Biotin-requiring enzyme
VVMTMESSASPTIFALTLPHHSLFHHYRKTEKPWIVLAVMFDQDVDMVELMKMQIPVQSMVEGRIKTIKVNEDDFVDEGAVLMEVE